MSREVNKLKSEKGAIFLETALVLPIFMILLCFSIDLPRIMSAKQKLIGASRLVAEIRARNNGNCAISTDTLKSYFFESRSAQSIKLTITNAPTKRSMLGGVATYIKNNWGEFGKIIDFIANIVSGGNFDPYFINVFETDKFYGNTVSADMPTILPSDMYNTFVNTQGPSTHVNGRTAYMPNCDSCKYTGTSFVEKLVAWIHNL